MSTTKSNLSKVKNNSNTRTVRKDKHHHKGKSKSKKEPLQSYDPRFEPYTGSKGSSKTLLHADITSFWKYSPRNPFFPQKTTDKINGKTYVTSTSTSCTLNKKKISRKTSAGNMSSLLSRRESDNTAAVNEARREIEKIKTELETLINANIKTQSFYTESMNLIKPEIETLLNTAEDVCNNLTTNNVNEQPDPPEPEEPDPAPPEFAPVVVKMHTTPKPVIKTCSMSSSPSPSNRKKPSTPTTVPCIPPSEADATVAAAAGPIAEQTTSRQKCRPYDAEKTREFIKKQKQRRKEKLLEEEQKKQEKENARKNKLEELKKKTLQLVSNNLKKSNSKSAKSPSDLLNTNNTSKSNNAQIDNKTVTNNQFLLQSRRCRARSFDNVNRDKERDFNKRSRSISREITTTTTTTSKHSEKHQQQQQQQQLLLPAKIPEVSVEKTHKNYFKTPLNNNERLSVKVLVKVFI